MHIQTISLLQAKQGFVSYLGEYWSFEGFVEMVINPLFRKVSRQRLLKEISKQEEFVQGTVDSDSPLVQYQITQDVTTPVSGKRDIILYAKLFVQDPNQGWRELAENASKKCIQIDLNTAQWRDNLISEKLRFEEEVEATCNKVTKHLQKHSKETSKSKDTFQVPDAEKMQDEEILHILST